MVNFIYKVVACIFLLLEFGKFLVRNIVRSSHDRQEKPEFADDSSPQKEDLLHPFEEKLKQLEALVVELSSKSSRIPEEKDEILADSLNRIRSMECDLQKTKKALFVTASKQIELEESLDTLREGTITVSDQASFGSYLVEEQFDFFEVKSYCFPNSEFIMVSFTVLRPNDLIL